MIPSDIIARKRNGEELADRNHVSPEIGMWAPNGVLLIIALYLILYVIRERAPIPLFTFLKNKED